MGKNIIFHPSLRGHVVLHSSLRECETPPSSLRGGSVATDEAISKDGIACLPARQASAPALRVYDPIGSETALRKDVGEYI